MYSHPDISANIAGFFELARKREAIRLLRKSGAPPPWSDDPVFQNNRFCNVHREDDKTTVWFRENMRNHTEYQSTKAIILGTVAFRWFNKIEIGSILREKIIGLQDGKFDVDIARSLILQDYPKGPFVTGAYIVKTPDGRNKLDGVLWCIEQFAHRLAANDGVLVEGSLERTWELLKLSPYLGDFMAYEVVTDLRHTRLLWDAYDILTWANPGPGCARGISRLFSPSANPEEWSRSRPSDRNILIDLMRNLLTESKRVPWIADGQAWEMRDVEHWACESDKYARVMEGGRMKQKFKGTAP